MKGFRPLRDRVLVKRVEATEKNPPESSFRIR